MKGYLLALKFLFATIAAAAQVTLLPFNGAWRYLDNGTDQGTAWRAPAFNDGTWKTGNGKFGYGITDAATIVSYGPDSRNKYITTYFRTAFSLANPTAHSFYTANIHCDDGAVVYVNGTEVFRLNMRAGAVTYDSLAIDGPADDGATPVRFNIPNTAFISGTNVVAVEIHQKSVTSSDIAFDLQLSTPDVVPPSVSSINRLSPLNAVTAATAVTWRVQFSEPVTGVGRSDFILTKTGTATGIISTLVAADGSGTLYDVLVNTITGNGTLRLDLRSSSTGIADLAGNLIPNVAYTGGQLYTIDMLPPSVVSINRQSPAGTGTTSAASVVYQVLFSEIVSGVDAADFLATTVSGSATGSVSSVQAVDGTTYDVTVGAITGSGQLRLDLNSTGTAIIDEAGNAITGGFTSGASFDIDRIAPSVVSIQNFLPATPATNASQVTYRVQFSEGVSGVDATDFSLRLAVGVSGTLAATAVAPAGTDGSTYDVTVTNVNGSGTIHLDLNAAGTGITDLPGNSITSGFVSGQSYQIDQTAPVVNSISRLVPLTEFTTAGSVTFRVIFSEPVSGVDPSDFTITTSGTLSAVSWTVSGGVQAYDVTVSGLTGSGVLRLDLRSANTGIADAVGNLCVAGYQSGETYSIGPADATPPAVLSILRQLPTDETTAATTVIYRVAFSEQVSGVDPADFVVTILLGAPTAVTGVLEAVGTEGTTFDLALQLLGGSGTIRLDLKSSGTGITDIFGNSIQNGFTTGETYNIEDRTAPSVVSITRHQPASGEKLAASPLTYRVVFSEPVTGMDYSDLTLVAVDGSADGTLTASAVSPVGTSGTTFDVTVSSVTGEGRLRLDLKAAGTGITDASGNVISSGFTTGEIFWIDGLAPQVLFINRNTPASENVSTASVVFRIGFSESITGLDLSDFSLQVSGTAGGTIAPGSLVAVGTGGTTFDITVSSLSGSGTLRLDLNPGAGISDGVGNILSSGYNTGQSYTIDPLPVVVSINRQNPLTAEPVSNASVTYRILFSEPVTGVDPSDFLLQVSGTANGVIASTITAVGTDVYDLGIGSLTGTGTIQLVLKSTGTGITDAGGNQLSGGFTGQTYSIDRQAPVVLQIRRQSPLQALTSSAVVTFRINFSEPVSGVNASDFLLAVTGSATGVLPTTAVTNVGTDATTYDVSVTNIAGAGTLRLDLAAANTGITDLPGNSIAGGYTSGESYNIDRVAPVVTSIRRQSPTTATTTASSLTYRVTFSEPVSGIDVTDFLLTTTGSVTGQLAPTAVANVGTDGTVFDVTVTQVTGDGTMRLDLKASGTGITDAAGNPIITGFTTGELYTIQAAPYVVSLLRQSPLAEAVSVNSVVFRILFSEKVSGVDAKDFQLTVSGSVTANIGNNAVAAVGTTGTTYDITVGSISGNGTLRLDLKGTGTGITDVSGNAITGGYTTGESYIIGQGPVVVSINRQLPTTVSTTAGEVTFRVAFNKKVTGVDAKDFLVTAVTGNVRGSLAALAMAPAGVKGSGSVVAVGSGGDIYDVSVRALAGNGTLRLDLKSTGTGIKDATNNAITTGFTTGQTYTVQQTGGFGSFYDVAPLAISTNTGQIPQAKVWTYAGKWWSVLPTSGGTKIFRLDGTVWTRVLDIHGSGDVKADCIVRGSVTHILLFRGASETSLASVEYDATTNGYKMWTERPSLVSLGSLGTGVESASITVDDGGTMWLAWDGSTEFKVRSSPSPYNIWSAEYIVASGATTDDICTIVAFPGKVGLLWSDQNAKRFGFRTHTNGAALGSWSANENPAAQSAKNLGLGFADDHMNIVAASNGTLYCVIKTGYDTEGEPFLGLLVRRPTGTWDNMYPVTSSEGTKPQVVLNETAGKVKVVYASKTGSSGGEDIMYRESPLNSIAFSRPYTLLGGDLAVQYNYVTTTHQRYTNELVIVSSEVTSSPDRARTIFATEVAAAPTTIQTSSVLAPDLPMQETGPSFLLEARPNPFTAKTQVRFRLPESGNYILELFNESGTRVGLLKQGWGEKGVLHQVEWDGSFLVPGVYLLQVKTVKGQKTIKVVMVQ